jgi:hypothetical protein
LIPIRKLEDIARRRHLEVIDLLPGLQSAARENPRLYFPVNLHWTAAGHRVVADILLTELDRPAR